MRPIVAIAITLGLALPIEAQRGPRHHDLWQDTSQFRHMRLETERTLSDADRRELEKIGVRFLKLTGATRWIISVDPSLAVTLRERSGAVASVAPFTREEKIGEGIAGSTCFGRRAALRITFHEDVPFDEARAIVLGSGAQLADPFATTFGMLRSVEVSGDRAELERLAAEDAVLFVSRPLRRIEPHNARAAALSSVTPLHAAPYDLTGEGVKIAVFDIGMPEATHPEFGGRITRMTASGSASTHPSHVTGTIAARGINTLAKGMAPSAQIVALEVDDEWFKTKDNHLVQQGLRADNNSWGYVLGWNQNNESGGWEWAVGTRELFGSYSYETQVNDALAVKTGTLLVHSAGNDNNDFGPDVAPFVHKHLAEPDDSRTYCYSANGSGNDCSAPCQRCETERHPKDGPFFSIGLVASAKNIVSVGAINENKTTTSFSSRGPTLDGRIKPEVVAKGSSQFSTSTGTGYTSLSGTSMSAPVVTGISALLIEQWRRSMGGTNPESSMLRALLIHGAEDIGNPGPDFTFGFGLVNAKASVDAVRNDSNGGKIRSDLLTTGQSREYNVNFTAGQPARVTVAWLDPEGAFNEEDALPKLINDIDMKVIDPSGAEIRPWILDAANPEAPATRGVNNRDNVEQIEIASPAGGSHRIVVTGRAIAKGPQRFSLVTNGTIGGEALPCSDVFEPNDTAANAFGRLTSGATISPILCPGDVDFFRFTVEKAGSVVVNVRPTVPSRVTVTNDRGFSITVEASATSPAAISASVTAVPANFTVSVEPIAALSAPASYTVSVTYPFDVVPRRRTSRR